MKFDSLESMTEYVKDNYNHMGNKIVVLVQNDSIASVAIYDDNDEYRYSILALQDEGEWRLADSEKARIASLAFLNYISWLVDFLEDDEENQGLDLDSLLG